MLHDEVKNVWNQSDYAFFHHAIAPNVIKAYE